MTAPGGCDYILANKWGKPEPALHAAVRVICARWPEAVFWDKNAEDLSSHDLPAGCDEIFAFRDRASQESWKVQGAVDTNRGTLLHMLANEREVTVVTSDENDPLILPIREVLHQGPIQVPVSRSRRAGPRGHESFPEVSEERVAELVKLGVKADDPSFHETTRHIQPADYVRESPPLRDEVRSWLDAFPTIPAPASPALVLLWNGDRVVYVGRSIYGLFGEGMPAHFHGPASRANSQAKTFDRVSIIHTTEDLLDPAVGALIRLLRPKYNRLPRREENRDTRETDQAILDHLGLAAA